jgi:hypothetical protein
MLKKYARGRKAGKPDYLKQACLANNFVILNKQLALQQLGAPLLNPHMASRNLSGKRRGCKVTVYSPLFFRGEKFNGAVSIIVRRNVEQKIQDGDH